MTRRPKKPPAVAIPESVVVRLERVARRLETIADDPAVNGFDDGWPGAAKRAAGWLERQKMLGFVSPDGAATVERLIEDLR